MNYCLRRKFSTLNKIMPACNCYETMLHNQLFYNIETEHKKYAIKIMSRLRGGRPMAREVNTTL